MKKFAFLFALTFAFTCAQAKNHTVVSPSGALKMVVNTDESLKYNLYVQDQLVLKDCRMNMVLSDGTVLGAWQKGVKDSRGSRTETIEAPLYRQSSFDTKYNYLNIRFKTFTLQVRAYNDGVAYRFVTDIPGQITVSNETVEYNFASDYNLTVPYTRGNPDPYESSFEAEYTEHKAGQEGIMADRLGFLPIVADLGESGKLVFVESDVEDYPGQFLKQTESGFKAEFPPVPATFRFTDKAVKRAASYTDYIAVTSGSRAFPWRLVGYAASDAELPVNNIVFETASASRVEDTSWIIPGQSTWDWWTANTMYDVPFKAGINTATYKYYIDFASDHKIPYVIVDEGWYKNFNLLQIADDIDVDYLIGYAQESGVKLILWSTVSPLYSNLEEVCRHYSALGLGGFKVDFFDSQDQVMVNTIYEIAACAAKYHLILDFHGMYKPGGLNKTFPNILNFEGVHGMEQLKWMDTTSSDMPRNDCLIPFLRQVAGPLDYTQGGLRNETKYNFRAIFPRPQTQGTRAHQVALYVVLESPLTMLADSPSDYLRDTETLDFITSIPTVVDKTVVLDASMGEYIVTAREANGKWYVGGITNWNERDVLIDFSFLGEGAWKATIFRDGTNSAVVARDFVIKQFGITPLTTMPVHMAPGGGFAMIIEKL